MSRRDRICGTSAPADSVESVTEVALAAAETILSQLRVPRRVKFTPSQLADDVGGTARAWQRECKLGNLGAVRVPGGWLVPWRQLVLYFAERQNLVSLN